MTDIRQKGSNKTLSTDEPKNPEAQSEDTLQPQQEKQLEQLYSRRKQEVLKS